MQLSHSQSQLELFLFMLDQRHRLFLLSVLCELQSAATMRVRFGHCRLRLTNAAGRGKEIEPIDRGAHSDF